MKPQNPLRMTEIKNDTLRKCAKRFTKLAIIEKWYDTWIEEHSDKHGNADALIEYFLKCLDIDLEVVYPELLETTPKKGPIVFVANHPFGGIEGLLLTQLLRRVRPDLKVLTNEMLLGFEEFKQVFIGVDVLSSDARQKNREGIRTTAKHLSAGNALLVFPAGKVSEINPFTAKVADTDWDPTVIRLIRKYKASVQPIFVEGRNPLYFYYSRYIHRFFRTMLLPRVLINKRGDTVRTHIGRIISNQDLKKFECDESANDFIRMCCELLPSPHVRPIPGAVQAEATPPERMEILDDQDLTALIKQVESLEDCLLEKQGDIGLYCAPYNRLGCIMDQLAVERERTFRAVGEGTGGTSDRDYYDTHYMHLFLWDYKNNKIAGGYRLGKVDEIIKEQGIKGLYSASLFKYDKKFLNKIGTSIEVGRSFVVQEYQQKLSTLDLLWRGIGRFVAQNPTYHTLFGGVSISSHYSKLVTSMLMDTFLEHYRVDKNMKLNVKAKKPFSSNRIWTLEQITHFSKVPLINKLVDRIETGKSIPILIRHYLSLNGKFITFGVNEGFNNSLDGMILVDLRKAPERYLKRYMGEEGMDIFKKNWNTD